MFCLYLISLNKQFWYNPFTVVRCLCETDQLGIFIPFCHFSARNGLELFLAIIVANMIKAHFLLKNRTTSNDLDLNTGSKWASQIGALYFWVLKT